jgi:hypothetical protein
MKRNVYGIDTGRELAAGARFGDVLAFARVPVGCWFAGQVGGGAARSRWLSRFAGALLVLACGCGDEDVTRLYGEETLENAVDPSPPAESRTFAVLSERESLDAVCRLFGVSSAGAGGAAVCSNVVESCRANVEGLLGPAGSEAPGLEVPAASLEPLLGCPLSLAQLDGCIGRALERSVEEYGSSVSCDMPALPEVDTLALFASPECLSVVLLCPDLLAAVAEPR